MSLASRFLIGLGVAVLSMVGLVSRVQAAPCKSQTMIVVAHPDDGFAFIHDTVPSLLNLGGCVDLVSLTSYYDDGLEISGREEGARAIHELFIRGQRDTTAPDTFSTATRLTYGNYDAWRYEVFNDNQVRLYFFRLPASAYPGLTRGSIYEKRSQPGLIDALAALMRETGPSLLLTLNTQGLLVENTACDVQRNGVFSVNECDHYDHVAAAQLAKEASIKSRVSMEVREHNTYDIAAGLSANQTISLSACGRLCEARNVYVEFDPLAAATPWGSLLSSNEKFRISQRGSGETSPPDNAVTCAQEGAICVLPAGTLSKVYYGVDKRWNMGTSLSGAVTCNNNTFGDPAFGHDKVCRYVADSVESAVGTLVRSLLPSGLCVGTAAGQPFVAGARMVLSSCAVAPVFELTADRELKSGNLCLTAGTAGSAGSYSADALIVTRCRGQAGQRWTYSSSTQTVQHAASGKLLDVPYSRDAPGQVLDVFLSNGGGANQRWSLQR